MARLKTQPPRGILKTPVLDRQRFRHARYHPSADLEEYVEHYWLVEWDLQGQAPERAETLPHPSVHVIFERNVGGRITGVARGKFSRLLQDDGGVFAVKFKPGGFYPFAGVSLTTFTDRVAALHEVWGDEAEALARAVLSEREDAPRVQIVEEFLRRRRPPPDPTVSRVAQIVYAVAEDRQIGRVEDIVARYDVSKRTLQRLFAKYVGVSPKWVIQRYRLHEAAGRLAGSSEVSQASLAVELGYSHQAHFVRDFKKIVGTPPAAFARAATAPARRSKSSVRPGSVHDR